MKNKLKYFFLIPVICLSSCSDDIESTYSSYSAYFVCTTVSTIPQLNSALNSWGVFTTIRSSLGTYVFTDESGGSTSIQATTLSNYLNFYMGIGGFIVGLPSIPELGSDTSVPVCFDLACSNCYENYAIARSLNLEESGTASCGSCDRIYDLNNLGIITDGDDGISLFRYRITYTGNTMVINN